MSRRISSSMTVIHKFVLPTLWTGGLAAGTVAMFVAGDPSTWPFLGALILSGGLVCWHGVPLKRVAIDGDELVVSNYRRTIRVPLGAIRCVTEYGPVCSLPVWIDFDSRTEFGRTIKFIPQARKFAFFTHPIVGELRRLGNCVSDTSGLPGPDEE